MDRVASIDIGTNTILLLVATTEKGVLKPLFEMETMVRLGEGLQKSGVISEEAMKRGYQTLSHYVSHCRERGVERIFAVGTSALREAKNSGAFVGMIRERLGLPIEIISGEREARLSYLAVAKDMEEAEGPILVIDVGGGSTELILGRGERICQWVSLPIGLVRLTEQHLTADPVLDEEWEKMVGAIHKGFSGVPHPHETVSMVSVGGTGTTLASVEQGLKEFSAEKIHHFVLTKDAIGKQLVLYRSKTIEERKKIPGLAPARADIILAGGTILYMAMEKFGSPSVTVSCHGVRYGLLYESLRLGFT
jgi:exopolyphosphatase / guanosine-5'-triphosphate,3'-diphosphate pyrophosphatase